MQALFKAMDTDGNGKVSKSETQAFAQKLYDQLASNWSASSSQGSSLSAVA